MAENPVVVEVPEDEWVLAAQAVTSGVIHRMSRAPTSYLQTFVKTGDAAPTDRSNAASLFFADGFANISSDTKIDVYVQAAGKSGSVRIDTGGTIESGSVVKGVNSNPRTSFGELLVGSLYPQIQGSFEYTVDNSDLNENTEVNGGTVTQASGMAVVGSSITTASTALFQSKQHAKYRAGLGGNSRFTALFTLPVAATEQYIGIADEVGSVSAFKNGYMVGYDGTIFGFQRFSNDSLITIAQADWDDPMLDGTGASGMILDHTKLNVFGIRYQYLGAGKIELCIEDASTGEFVVAHTILYANLNTEPSVHNPNFHHTMWVNNKATISDIVLKSGSYAYFVEGQTSYVELHQPINSSDIREKVAVTSELAIFTIRNRAAYAGKVNFIDAIILSMGASIEASSANNLATVKLIKNATLGGTPSYSDINTNNSVIEIDTSGTTVTGGTILSGRLLAGKNDSQSFNLSSDRIILNPGETLTISGLSANSATIDALLVWRELF